MRSAICCIRGSVTSKHTQGEPGAQHLSQSHTLRKNSKHFHSETRIPALVPGLHIQLHLK